MPSLLTKYKRNRTLLFSFLIALFAIHYSLFTSAASAAPGDPPNPQPCNNPVPAYIRDSAGNVIGENLTDNYLTNEEGDPPGPIDADGDLDDPEAMMFTFIRSAEIGTVPEVTKTIRFKADFSRLQALFGTPNSDYAEGGFQSEEHAKADLVSGDDDSFTGSQLLNYQTAGQKAVFKVMTDVLRENYARYVYDKPELAESDRKFADNEGKQEKTVHDLVTAYGLPDAPEAGEQNPTWKNGWGKYWEKIPTVYDEFYIGKLEFRAVHGSQKIEALKRGDEGTCSPNDSIRTVEFPTPRFFRTAATTGSLNEVLVPKIAQSEQNRLINLTGAVLGVKTTGTNFIQNCFKFAKDNPISKLIKKTVKVSIETIRGNYDTYASHRPWTLSASVDVDDVHFSFSPAANHVMALVVYNSDGSVALDTGWTLDGKSSYNWNNQPPGDYRAILFAFGVAPVSHEITFSIAKPGLGTWNLSVPPSPIRGNVRFNFSPNTNDVIALVVYRPDNSVALDTGWTLNGQSSYTWTNPRPGNYRAVLIAFGVAAVSNEVNFEVQWLLNNPAIAPNQVDFTFTPQGNNDGANLSLLVYLNVTPRPAAWYDSANSGVNLDGDTSLSLPTDKIRWGDWVAVLLKGINAVSNEVTYHVPYILNQPTRSGEDVIFTWTPPIHVANPTAGMAILVRRVDNGNLAWDSGQLPLDSTTITWQTADPGKHRACLLYNGDEKDGRLEPDDLICKTFDVPFNYPWKVFPLKEDSCIKVHKEGKAGNAPYCAIYPTKFEPGVEGQPNVNPGECVDQSDGYKLNSEPRVICTFTFTWRSTDYTGDSSKSLVIPETGNGNWDSCSAPAGRFRTCRLRVGVWPDFRIPYLCQISNNTLYSDTKEVCPTLQETNRPGVYSFGQPKVIWDEQQAADVSFTEEDVSQAIFYCITSVLPNPIDKTNPYCQELLGYISQLESLGRISGCDDLSDVFGKNPLDPTYGQTLEKLRNCASAAFIEVSKKLPGEVNSGVAGASTGGGQVLAAADGKEKERFIGGVECGKHFTRDIMLKPKILQEELGVNFECNLEAETSGTKPGTDTKPGTGTDTETGTGDPTKLGYYIKYRDTSIRPADTNYIKQVAAGFGATNIDTKLNQVITRSISRGVSPAFAVTIWWEEGGFGGVPSADQFGMVNCSSHDFNSSLNCFLDFVTSMPYDHSNPYGSFYNFINNFCGPDRVYICGPGNNGEPANDYHIANVESIYKSVAPGEIVYVSP